MHLNKCDICVVGAGAAGLWAAAACAGSGFSTLLLEKTGRAGTKILSSGGSRCNLTTSLDANAAAKHYGSGAAFIKPALRALTPQDVVTHFELLGVQTRVEAEFQKVFPASNSAVEVRDAMLSAAVSRGAQIELNREVFAINADGGGWRVETRNASILCRRLILCAGGQSYPKSGTTGDAYPWLRALGLRVVHPVPALVPLTSSESWIHALSGIAVDVEMRIGDRRRRRPVLFTHTGLSGPAAMDLSEAVSRDGHREARLDFLPDRTQDEIRRLLIDAAERPGSPRIATLFDLPRRVFEALMQRSTPGNANPSANQIDRKTRSRIVESLKALPVSISGTRGFAKAEVTAGGLALSEVNRKTMQVKGHPGLFVCGELLDLTGPIGGFNFQAAFSTAELAARGACRSLDSAAGSVD